VIDATGAAPVDVCGVSIGGMTALWAAVHAAKKIRRVILANTAAKIGDTALWNERIRSVRADGMRSLAEATMRRWFTERFRTDHRDAVSRFRTTIERTNADGYAGCCAALRDGDLRSAAATVTCPAMIVIGTHDPATPPDAGRWLAEQIPGAQLVELDAAHLSNVECPEAFNTAVRRFLAD